MKIGARLGAFILGMALLTAVPAHASIVVAVQFVSALVGSTGNELDVTLQNTGSDPISVAGFNFSISTADTDITFTSTTDNTSSAPYVFAGNSFFGPTISTLAPGQTMDASDLYGGSDTSCSPANPNAPPAFFPGACVAGGSTVGLGNVQFDVSGGATPGSFAVTLATDPSATTLTDPNGNSISIQFFDGGLGPGVGQITVSTVPEPASALLLVGALAGLVVAKRRQLSRG